MTQHEFTTLSKASHLSKDMSEALDNVMAISNSDEQVRIINQAINKALDNYPVRQLLVEQAILYNYFVEFSLSAKYA